MKRKTYDLDKLADSGKFDIGVRKSFFYNMQDYFDALTDFEQHYKRELGNYNPTFVTHCEDNREELMRECFELRAVFVRLGMTELLNALDTLENAAITKPRSVLVMEKSSIMKGDRVVMENLSNISNPKQSIQIITILFS